MLARDKVRLDALRGAKKEFLEALTEKGADREHLSDERAIQILAKMIKQREESTRIYREQKREDLAQSEEQEKNILQEFLPSQLECEEIVTLVDQAIAQLGVTDMKGMGKVMGVVSKQTVGRADGKVVAEIVKSRLETL